MLRLVALADTHLFHDRLVVPGGDILVHAGDLLRHGDLDELAAAVDYLRGLPHPVKIVVAGNHDVCLQRQPEQARATLEGLHYLEDEEANVAGYRFYGSPWQPKFRVWAFGATRGPELAAKWERIPEGIDVLVTHGPPFGFGDRVSRGSGRHVRVGCVDLLARVREVRPPLHVFGHIHQDPGRWTDGLTTFVNVTTAEGTHPATVVDLPLRS